MTENLLLFPQPYPYLNFKYFLCKESRSRENTDILSLKFFEGSHFSWKM